MQFSKLGKLFVFGKLNTFSAKKPTLFVLCCLSVSPFGPPWLDLVKTSRMQYYTSISISRSQSFSGLQEVGIWGQTQSPRTGKPTYGSQCIPNSGAVPADPYYDNPTYQIFYTNNYTLSNPLTLTILLESWPINTYPFVVVLSTGSNLIVAGDLFIHSIPSFLGPWWRMRQLKVLVKVIESQNAVYIYTKSGCQLSPKMGMQFQPISNAV